MSKEYRIAVEWPGERTVRHDLSRSADPHEKLAALRAHHAEVKKRIPTYGVGDAYLEEREEATPWKRTQE